MSTDRDWLEKTPPESDPADLAFLALEETFVSGDPSGHRLRVNYFRVRADGSLLAKVLFGPGAQGPPDHVHGGAQAALMDETMGGAAWVAGHPVVAAQLNTTFKAMVPLTARAVIRARVEKVEGRKVWTRATLGDETGEKVYARAEALFLTLDENHIAALSDKARLIIEAMRKKGL